MIVGKFEIREPVFDYLVYWGMISMVLVVLAVVMNGLMRVLPDKKRRTIVGLGAILWLAILGIMAEMEWLTNQEVRPSPFILIPVSVVSLSCGVSFSRFGKFISTRVSLFSLVVIHVFRFPLELLMHQAYKRGIMPEVLSFEGLNFDVFTGIGALLIALIWAWRGVISTWIIWLWNIYGIGCLLMIFYIAVRSSPMIKGWGNEPEKVNTWVLYFPYIWLPTVLVVIAFTGHIIVTRKLLLMKC